MRGSSADLIGAGRLDPSQESLPSRSGELTHERLGQAFRLRTLDPEDLRGEARQVSRVVVLNHVQPRPDPRYRSDAVGGSGAGVGSGVGVGGIGLGCGSGLGSGTRSYIVVHLLLGRVRLIYPAHRSEKRRAATAGSGYAAADKRLSPCERSRSSTAASIVAPGSAAGTARTSITSPSA